MLTTSLKEETLSAGPFADAEIGSPRLVVADTDLVDLSLFIIAYTEIKNYWPINL